MKVTVITLALFSLTAALPVLEDAQAQTIMNENDSDGTGNYVFSYRTSNGITREETGYLVNVGKDDEHVVVEGSYSYADANQNEIRVRYHADENGFNILPPNQLDVGSATVGPAKVPESLLGK